MDLLQSLFTLISISIVLIFIRLFYSKPKKHVAPVAGGAWPIIGHWPVYFLKKPAHRALGAMADKYGPIFFIKVGSQRILMLNCPEIAKECYTVHDKLLDRPSITASEVIGYNNAMLTFNPYGSNWRAMRKIVTLNLVSNHRIDMFKYVRASEVEIGFKDMYMTWEKKGKPKNGIPLDMKQKFHDITSNISLRMIAGKRLYGDSVDCGKDEARHCRKVIREFVDLIAVLPLSDVIPWLGWLDNNGYQKAMKRTADELDKIVGGWLDEHKKEIGGKEKEKHDMLDVLLNLNHEGLKISGFDSDTMIKAVCLDMIFAMSDTSMIVIAWALSLLLNNPHVLKKVQDELDIHISKNRHVEDSDIKNLVYLQAVIKETLRLYPPVPLLNLRYAMVDFTISKGNYHVSAGSRLMLNAWKIHRDPNVWPDPERFEPERFLTSHEEVEVGGHSYKLIPFGLGRRSCPGVSLGLRTITYLLAGFLHSFEVAKLSSKDVDMTEINTITNPRATPLEVFITPCLDRSLYGVI